MTERPEDLVGELLDGAIEELDIPERLQNAAERVYSNVGEWLQEKLADGTDWHVYSQGSMRLGTVVRPSVDDEYDLDAVAELNVAKDDITKEALRTALGDALEAYVAAHVGQPNAPSDIKEGGRCWTLRGFDNPFHMDWLPAIPNPKARPDGILITDEGLHPWQPSNPVGFANWFYERMGPELTSAKAEIAKRAKIDIDDVPNWRTRTVLQRVVQVLKVHRNSYFEDAPEDRPPSIILTTLAGLAFAGDGPLFDATMGVASRMRDHIERDGDLFVVTNPVDASENFADRWGGEERRVARFNEWIDELQRTLDAARTTRAGIQEVATKLEKSFGATPVKLSVARWGERRTDGRRAGSLTVAATGLIGSGSTKIRDHDFHGDDAR